MESLTPPPPPQNPGRQNVRKNHCWVLLSHALNLPDSQTRKHIHTHTNTAAQRQRHAGTSTGTNTDTDTNTKNKQTYKLHIHTSTNLDAHQHTNCFLGKQWMPKVCKGRSVGTRFARRHTTAADAQLLQGDHGHGGHVGGHPAKAVSGVSEKGGRIISLH